MQHQSIMDFLLSFIRFLRGDAAEATLAQNERHGEKEEGARGEVRDFDGEKQRPTETQNSINNKSPQEYSSHVPLESLRNTCFNLFARPSSEQEVTGIKKQRLV